MSAGQAENGELTKSQLTALRRVWYNKLKDRGFKDIEVLAPDGNFYDVLKHPLRIDPTSEEYQEQGEYYRRAREFAHYHHFKTQRERIIWELHSDGYSYREIEEVVRVSDTKITLVLRKLRIHLREYVLDDAQRHCRLDTQGEIEDNIDYPNP